MAAPAGSKESGTSLGRSFCKLCLLIFIVFTSLFLVCLIRALTFENREIDYKPCKVTDEDYIRADGKVVDRLVHSLRFKTVSTSKHEYNRDELLKFQFFLKREFPTVHNSSLVKHEVVNGYSLLYELPGTNPELKPYLLAAHLDVVPASDEGWEHPPFDGVITEDGHLYGRGTLDNKDGVLGILEALEFHLKRGFKPKRTLFVALGHDEEVGGDDGAAHMAQMLKDRGIQLEFVIDEGMPILSAGLPMIDKPVAIIGAAEKGYVTLEFKVEVPGGHSSMPPPETSIGILSKALARLEASPHPDLFGYGPEAAMMEHMAPHMSFLGKFVMTNLWLFGPLVSRALASKPATNGQVRTTTAITVFNSGIKDNVLPPVATAYVNHRIHPAQSIQDVIDYDKAVINDERVQIKLSRSVMNREPSPISPTGPEDFGYQIIRSSVKQVFPDAVTVPGILMGNTDTKHYLDLTKSVYRFLPAVLVPEDSKRIHGFNERIAVQNFEQIINFFYHLILNADQEKLQVLHSHTEEL
ncbi:N-fatty-acyl-amino acid synthase/hydrolase PM20D1 [Lingula anatina]|uniref:N-fatty-acyl-amino acid synthase/hydrolase PM20D1 n=1 Tax=Lingula anatina TaxID=7574 RepID=A0A1S3ICY6_LINAN|nr:N-fatty-acyl-amino acid synthase/hydrolase PM20D1 [Lingula anatina]|eukprot:XP_013396028.1 N-fatty-acyl-amino acid synthase/hydrolase PM20D1 [Lingula anatina]